MSMFPAMFHHPHDQGVGIASCFGRGLDSPDMGLMAVCWNEGSLAPLAGFDEGDRDERDLRFLAFLLNLQ